MKLNATAVRHGAAVGAVQVALTLIAYIVNTSWLFDPWFGLSSWVLIFVGMYLALKGIRQEEGNVLSFKRAWGHAYVVAGVNTLIVIGFSILLYQIIDPGLVDLAVSTSMERIEEVAALMGGGSELSEAFDQIEPEIRNGLSPLGQAKSAFWSLIFYAIPTVIMALVMRRKEDFGA